MIKKLAIGLAALIVVIAVGCFFMWSNLDHLIKVAIEKYGTAATQASVTLDSVKLSLTSGAGSLNGLTVGNPKGFSSGNALSLGSIAVQVDTSSIAGKGPIVIRQIAITKPQVTYELASDGGNNLQTIARNTQGYASAAAGNHPATTDAGAAPSSGSGRKVIITDLIVTDGQVGVSSTMLSGKSLSAPLPTIHLTNIGKASGGATAAQVAQQVLGAITNEAAKVATSQFASQITSSLKGAASGAMNKGVTGVSGVGGQLKGLIGQ